jgi:NADH-quinone oxidoreductase subunit N
MDIATISKELPHIIPELVLACGAMLAVLIGAFVGKKSYSLVNYFCGFVFLLAGFASVKHAPDNALILFNGGFIVDNFGSYAKLIISVTAAFALLLSIDYLKDRNMQKPEYPILAVLAVLGMFVMVSSHNLLALYMGVELQSLALYVLAAYARDSQKSSEAGLKYFVLGALSSGILLYGASFIYGFTGTIDFSQIAATDISTNKGLMLGMVFVIAGIAFKMSAAPFHMWTPDVYEGSPTPSTAFFATAPKMAAAVLLARFCFEAFGPAMIKWQPVIAIMAVLSMFIGAFGALQQTNIKRMLAYSSIANMGYALVAIAAGPQYGASALLMFISIYALTGVGMFGVVLSIRSKKGVKIESIPSFAGLSKQNPMLALAFTMLLFSLMGIPPLAGFMGKWEVLKSVWLADHLYLAIALIMASVISAFYYLRVIRVMWFDEPSLEMAQGLETTKLSVTGAAIILAFLTPFIGVLYAATLAAGNLFK